MDESHDLGFAAEYAKSDRSSCRLCKSCISKSSLRLAILVQSPHFDGKIPTWYHFKCFFKKAKSLHYTSQIKGFDMLRWDDQNSIKEKLGIATSKITASDDDYGGGNDKNEAKKDNEKGSVDNYQVEYAKSNRSKCRKCDKKIEKNNIRISKKIENKATNAIDAWYHLDCFVNNSSEWGFKFKAEDLPGFDEIEESDKENLKKLLGNETHGRKRKNSSDHDDDTKVKKEKTENNDNDGKKKEKNETLEREKQLKQQNVLFWKYRDAINNELSSDDIKELLEANNQKIVRTGRDDLINALADCLCFGALEKCPECKNGQLVYSSKYYYCSGNLTEWTKCQYKTQNPETCEFLIPNEFKEAFDFLEKYKFVSEKRLFAVVITDFDNLSNLVVPKKEEIIAIKKDPSKPFTNLKFASAGKLIRTTAQIRELIENLGGKISTKIDETIIALITNKNEFDNMSKKVLECKTHDVHVVSDEFLNEFDDGTLISKLLNDDEIVNLINKHKLSTWGSDIKTRIKNSDPNLKPKKTEDEKFCSKSLGTVKMKVKGGAAVDPDSGLENDAHTLREKDGTNDPYSVVLSLVDILRGTNSYYKLQILEHDKMSRWYLFRSWGRVGTSIGGNKLDEFYTRDDVIDEFERLYYDKTGNEWRYRKNFQKKPSKFFPIEVDYGDDDSEMINKIDKTQVSTSKLAKPIQNLIHLIFDIEKMKNAMIEFEIDLNKMPLGKLSSNQLKKAFSVLNELNDLIKSNSNKYLIIDASNRFYTLVPHDFALKKPTSLDNLEIIKSKTEMLNSLLDIEIAYNLLKDSSDGKEDPVDQHYKKLKCDIEILDRDSSEYKNIVLYVKNTHAATHSSYELVVEEIFKVSREGEFDRFKKYKTLHNRKLLWHGSRITNFAGILSQGLRIAPPEAPATGYMFGKGVYFADMVSKSANYCFTNKTNPTGLLLLCEVALGDMYERTGAEYVTKLPTGKHSTKGVGRTAPDPKESLTVEDGIEIPAGKGIDCGISRSSLLYNEYIVYDVEQVNIKYLIQMKFNYKY